MEPTCGPFLTLLAHHLPDHGSARAGLYNGTGGAAPSRQPARPSARTRPSGRVSAGRTRQRRNRAVQRRHSHAAYHRRMLKPRRRQGVLRVETARSDWSLVERQFDTLRW